jgi:PAS domain S-box-containing protein
MLQKLSGRVQECFEFALDAKRDADRTDDPVRKAGFLEMEKRWLLLARSLEFTERLTDFTATNADWRSVRDNVPRLQKVIQEGDVNALFERLWLASIVEFNSDAIHSNNLDGIITSWNKGAERLYSYFAEEAIGQPATIIIPPSRQHEDYIISERARCGERIEHFETIRQRKDRSLIEVSLTVSPMRDAGGKIIGASRIARDITDRKRSEAQIAVLAGEAEHRAKNLLANVEAIVALSRSDTADGLKEAIRGRIGALANVHSLFIESRWTGAELSSLVRQELSPYARAGEMRTLINGPAVILKPEVAQAMAVALHELATNAVKYGALSVTTGQVRVEWSYVEDGQLVLRWAEMGGPPVNPPTRKGFGTHMMEAMIRDHEGGGLRLNWQAEGLVCEISLPT